MGCGGNAQRDAQLYSVPELPPHYVYRVEAAGVTDALITGPLRIVGLHGMGGTGKSVVAAAVGRDERVRLNFSDGIIWVTVGQQPDELTIRSRQAYVAEALGDPPRDFGDYEQGRARLSALLQNKRCLLILDDIWRAKDIDAFGAPGPGCRILITTRDRALITNVGATELDVDIMTDDQALALLAGWVGQPAQVLPCLAVDVMEECGKLPLALAIVGAMARGKPNRWDNILHKLRNQDLAKIGRDFPNYPYPNLFRAIQVSVEALEPESLIERYLDLAVFNRDARIPEATICTYWASDGLDKFEVQDIIDTLIDRSLLTRTADNRVTLHDLLFDYVHASTKDARALHKRLLEAYRRICPARWSDAPNDGYFFENLVYHVSEAQEWVELDATLGNIHFIEGKCTAGLTYDLVRDYMRAEHACGVLSPLLKTFASFVRRESHNLSRLPALAFQLAANEPAESPVHQHAMQLWTSGQETRVWIRQFSGFPSRDAFALTYSGHKSAGQGGGGSSNWITCCRISPDEHCVASCDYDGRVHIWDASTGELNNGFAVLHRPATSCSWSPDSRRLAVACRDVVEVWDALEGRLVLLLQGHSSGDIETCAWSPDGLKIASGGGSYLSNFEVIIWNAATGKITATLSGHSREIACCVFSHDGSRLLSCSSGFLEDNDLILWDVDTAKEIVRRTATRRTFTSCIFLPGNDHVAFTEMESSLAGYLVVANVDFAQEQFRAPVRSPEAIAHNPQTRTIAVASRDQNLYLFDDRDGTVMAILQGHGSWVETCDFAVRSGVIASGSRDCTVRIWPANGKAGAQPADRKAHRMSVTCGAFSNIGSELVTGSDSDEHHEPCGSVALWNAITGELVRILAEQENTIQQCRFLPGDRSVLASTDGGYWATPKLLLLNPQDGAAEILEEEFVSSWSLDEAAGLLCKLHWGEGEVLKTDSWQVFETFSGAGPCLFDARHGLVITGRQLPTGDVDDVVLAIRLGEGMRILQPNFRTSLSKLTWSDDRRFVLAFSKGELNQRVENEVACWDADNGFRNILHLHSNDYRVASFRGNSLALSAGYDLLVFDLPEGRFIGSCVGHEFFITGCAAIAKHPWFVTGSLDMTVRLWDLTTRCCLALVPLRGDVLS